MHLQVRRDSAGYSKLLILIYVGIQLSFLEPECWNGNGKQFVDIMLSAYYFMIYYKLMIKVTVFNTFFFLLL